MTFEDETSVKECHFSDKLKKRGVTFAARGCNPESLTMPT